MIDKANRAAEAVICNYEEAQRLLPMAGGAPQPIEECRDHAVVLALAHRAAAAERDRLREALTWAVGFIRCNLPRTAEENAKRYPDWRNACDLVAGEAGVYSGEFHRMTCRAELAEDVVKAAVAGLGLKAEDVTPADVPQVIAGLQAEADLYRRGYDLIQAMDISNYLARCREAGQVLEG